MTDDPHDRGKVGLGHTVEIVDMIVNVFDAEIGIDPAMVIDDKASRRFTDPDIVNV